MTISVPLSIRSRRRKPRLSRGTWYPVRLAIVLGLARRHAELHTHGESRIQDQVFPMRNVPSDARD